MILITTSIAASIKNPFQRTCEHNHFYNFLFCYIKRGFVEFQNKLKFQTQSHNNLWFHSKMILFFLFGNYWVTIIASIHKKSLLSICCVDNSVETCMITYVDEQNTCKHWQARHIIDTDYLLNTWKYYMLLPKTC